MPQINPTHPLHHPHEIKAAMDAWPTVDLMINHGINGKTPSTACLTDGIGITLVNYAAAMRLVGLSGESNPYYERLSRRETGTGVVVEYWRRVYPADRLHNGAA